MKHSKLIDILKTFSKDEMKQFEKFVASAFHNSIKNTGRLLNELKKFYPEFDNDRLSYEYLYKKIYPGKKFNKQMMWNLISAMEKLAEEFMAQVSLRNDEFGRMKYIVNQYRDRSLRSNYNAMLQIMDKFGKSQINSSDYYYYLCELERMWREYHLLEDKQYLLCENALMHGEYLVLLFLKSMSSST